jgi:hypothetical protein
MLTTPHPPLATALENPALPNAALITARVVTINQCAQVRASHSPSALRDLKFKAHDRKNSRGETIPGNGSGLAGVWIQVGAKVLMDLDAFDRWIESHKGV